MNLIEPILRHGRTQPSTVALLDEDRTVTYGELAELVQRTAGHLSALGVRRGDCIGLCLRDNWQHFVALLAIARLGAIAVQIDPRARTAEKARIAAAFNFKLVLALPGSDMSANCATIAIDPSWHQRVAQAEAPNSLPDDWNDPMVAQSTAGTTGLSKFTIATHLQFYFRIASYRELMPAIRPHRLLASLPLFFGYGRNVYLLHLLLGSTLVLYPSVFTAAQFVDAVKKHRANVAAVVPATVRQLLGLAGSGQPLLPELGLLMCSGAPLFADEKRAAVRNLTPNFYDVYAASALGPISVLRPDDISERADSVGRPFPLSQVDIVDDDGRPVATDQIGRLRCRGPALASPIAGHSADEFRDGWHYPGELGAFDEHGYLQLHGRTSELIFRGGAKVFPTEVEAALQEHNKVGDAAVVARASRGNEQVLAAFVVARGDVTPGELMAYCRQRLTPYKVPQQIHVVSELPRNSSGKVDKSALATLVEIASKN